MNFKNDVVDRGMKSLKFIEQHVPGRFEYHLPVSYERFISTPIFNSGLNLEKEVLHDLQSFVYENAIASLNGWDENALLYAIALKTLADKKECSLICFDDPTAISKIQAHTTPTKAEWWNTIQFRQGDEFCQCFGIQGPEAFLEAVNYADKDLSNRYFYISDIENKNIHRYTHLYRSDVTNWCFIFCESENKHAINLLLSNKTEKPGLDAILRLSSSLVNIQIGGDEGYLDYVLIQSASDLRDAILEIEQKQLAFIQDYENLMKECTPFDEAWKVDFYKERVSGIIKNSL